MGKKKIDSSDLRKAIYDLTEDLNQLVSREHQILQDELGQVSTLVGDAIKTLVESFNSLNKQVAEQENIIQFIVAEVLDSNDQEFDQLNKLSELSKKINHNVVTATRSLQFDDIVQQLVTHSLGRTEQMEQLFDGLYERLFAMRNAESGNPTQIASYIDAMQEEVTHFSLALEKANPVKQTTMGSGETELF